MSYSSATVTATGSTNIFSVPFPFIQTEDVHVYVNGAEVFNYSWPTAGTIQLARMPSSLTAATVSVRRHTTLREMDVTFQEGGLSPDDLNTAFLQLLYLLQEEADSFTIGSSEPFSPYLKMSQLKQGLALIDTAARPVIAGNIPSNPYDPIAICWASAIAVQGDALFLFIQSKLFAGSQVNTEAFYTTSGLFPVNPSEEVAFSATALTVSQLKQGLAVADNGARAAIASNIPSNPYDPVAICWNGTTTVQGDALFLFIQSKLFAGSLANTQALYATCAKYSVNPF